MKPPLLLTFLLLLPLLGQVVGGVDINLTTTVNGVLKEIRGTVEAGTNAQGGDRTMTTNDNFTLSCSATKAKNSSLNLTVPHSSSASGPKIVNNTTPEKWQYDVEGNATKDYQGIYTCSLTMPDASHHKKINIYVHDEESVALHRTNLCPQEESPPHNNNTSNNNNCTLSVKEQSKQILSCEFTGKPKPEIQWLKDNQTFSADFLDDDTKFKHSVIKEELLLKNVSKAKHQGTYTCLAHNRISHASGKIYLNVPTQDDLLLTTAVNGEEIHVKSRHVKSRHVTVAVKDRLRILCAAKKSIFQHLKIAFLDSKGNAEHHPGQDRVTESDTEAWYQTEMVEEVMTAEYEGTITCTATPWNFQKPFEKDVRIFVQASSRNKMFLVFLGVGVVLMAAIVVFLVWRNKKERKFRKQFRRNLQFLFEAGNLEQLNPDFNITEQAELLPYSTEWEVNRQRLKMGQQLGWGTFGRVVKAELEGLEGHEKTTVAVKMCKSTSDASQVQALAIELKIMIHLGKHLNIVNLVGASTVNIGKGELWVLVEYCRYGDLLFYLQRHRHSFVNQIDPISGQIDHKKDQIDPHKGDNNGYSVLLTNKITETNSDKGPVQFPSCNENNERVGLKILTVNNPMYCDSRSALDNEESAMTGGSTTSKLPLLSSSPYYDLLPITSTCCVLDKAPPNGPNFSDPKKSSPSSSFSGRGNNAATENRYNKTPQPGMDMVAWQGNPASPGVGDTTTTTTIPGLTAPFTTCDLVCWAWQVAQGMEYLASRKVLHGDLALRNLLLCEGNVVKISDFGLSRDIYKNDVYLKKTNELLPIKWMSVEAIRDCIFSVQSDVWAYGVTLWELFSLGSSPYPGVEANKDFITLLEEGYRMEKPRYATQDIHNLMLKCWTTNPRDRPSFEEVSQFFNTLLQPDLLLEYETLNNTYLRMNTERFQNQTDYLDLLMAPEFHLMQEKQPQDNTHTYVNVTTANNNVVNETVPEVETVAAEIHYLLMASGTDATEP